MEEELFSFDSPLNQSSYIKVIGVGGGGNNAVNHMYRNGITGVDFIVSNTDMKALNGSPVPNKLVLGNEGLGVGGRPAKARKAAEEKADEIKALFEHNTKMIFITAGMGGGTGTGAAPVIAKIAKDIKLPVEDEDDPGKILVVAVVTTPFQFEGNRRIQQALEGVEELRKNVDSILVINNEKLRSYGNLCMTEAFSMANDVLLTAVKGIAEIITLNAYVNIDFRDVNTVMENSGTALMGIGTGEGENRARQAVEEAATSVLLNDNDIAGAKNVLLYLAYGPEHEITMDEMGEVTDYISQRTGSLDTNVIWGTGSDESLGDKVKITLIATGFDQKENTDPVRHVLNTERPDKPVVNTPVSKDPITEPVIIRHEEPVSEVKDVYEAPVTDRFSDVAHPIVEEDSRLQNPETPSQRKHIIPLDEDVKVETKHPVNQTADDGFVLVSRGGQHEDNRANEVDASSRNLETSKPQYFEVAEPGAAPMFVETAPQSATRMSSTPAASFRLDIEAMNRAERMKAMNDLLRNNADGPAIVEAMNPLELLGEKIYQGTHSSQSEASKTTLNNNGIVANNLYLYENPD